MPTITQMKCACKDCLCIVNVDNAITVEGKPYCSKACAEGHPEGSHGCEHSGCNC